jgi:CubicO group peptidase (beta-lactamase class C family)
MKLFIILILIFILNIYADNRIDRLFEKYNSTNSPGVAVMVTKNQRILYRKCFGMANLEDSIPITEKTYFDVASVSKQFTAISIAIALQHKIISLDDKITKYIDLPSINNNITIRFIKLLTFSKEFNLPYKWIKRLHIITCIFKII